ncbi:hypothetical protein H0H92_009961 [Tricholoma furcatifolium]|nr:hypothetical protein H0H92_009961 [Tricholoma furcatifolium]
MVSVAPQILLPLAADLAPPERQASTISVVLSGLLFGILIARVLAGVIAEFTSWRIVYFVAIGTQGLLLVGMYLFFPDYPSKNDGLTYWDILFTMAKFATTEPLLIQAWLINLVSSACFSNFWDDKVSSLVIGLFGLVGFFGVALGPIVGKVIDRLVPCIQTGAGGIHIGAVIVVTIGLDVFRQMLQVSLSTAVFSISAAARSRLNVVMILAILVGQVMGTSVGTKVFVNYGWRAGAALSMGWYGFQLAILLLRGPHCERFTWCGYEGGFEARKSVLETRLKAANAQPLKGEETGEVFTEKGSVSSSENTAPE